MLVVSDCHPHHHVSSHSLRILMVNVVVDFLMFGYLSYSKLYFIFYFFSNKINHNKIYDASKNILNKTNDQTLHKNSTTSIIKIQRKYNRVLQW
jgi:hypothetical protein